MLKLNSDTNRKKAIRQFVKTFCIFRFQDVSSRELDLLCEIINVGEVSERSKKNFIVNFETTKENYSQIVKRLSDKGILINKDRRNGKELHPDIVQLSESYINNQTPGKKIMLLEWRM